MEKSRQKFEEMLMYRMERLKLVRDRRMTLEEFSNSCFQYFRQNRLHPLAKAHDAEAILFNYYYWITQIERKVVVERKLLKYKLGSDIELYNVVNMYLKRRDQMVRRLIWEMEEPVEDAYIIFGDTVEILLKSGHLLHVSKGALDKVKYFVKKTGQSRSKFYTPLLSFKIESDDLLVD